MFFLLRNQSCTVESASVHYVLILLFTYFFGVFQELLKISEKTGILFSVPLQTYAEVFYFHFDFGEKRLHL